MEFKINRYDDVIFHRDEDIDKKIRVLFLLFDYKVTENRLTLEQQLELIDLWIVEFEDLEYYEVIPMFKSRREAIVKFINTEKYDNLSFYGKMVLKLKFKIKKIKNFIKLLFYRK